jgi:alginate O-acetyltransferase complex protein AlgI
MLFNSIEYLLFLPIVLFLYWFVFGGDYKRQNILIIIASYIFYGWWDWRFLSLIILSTVIDYYCGKKIAESKYFKKKLYLSISIISNLGILMYFKYSGFFLDSLYEILGMVGYYSPQTWSLDIILPVGISFYTFQTMSYSIDIYRSKIFPTQDFFAFAFYVSFFPQLVAGPIERAGDMLKQITQNRETTWKESVYALHLIIWGLFKKVVVADSLSIWVDRIFNSYELYGSFTLIVGVLFFSLQIYCDFSGYSTIAIGTAKLFGINLIENFNYPYLARNITEFWKRWHISLSTWFKDYIFIPLGGSRVGPQKRIVNIFITFGVSGLWHGANMTFILWGIAHAFMYMINIIFTRSKKMINAPISQNHLSTSMMKSINTIITFTFVSLAWVLFRSDSISDSVLFYLRLFGRINVSNELFLNIDQIVTLGIILISYSILGITNKKYSWDYINNGVIYYIIIDSIIISMIQLFGTYSNASFIYFQF